MNWTTTSPQSSEDAAARLLARIQAGELSAQAPGLVAGPPEPLAAVVRHDLASAVASFASLGLLAFE